MRTLAKNTIPRTPGYLYVFSTGCGELVLYGQRYINSCGAESSDLWFMLIYSFTGPDMVVLLSRIRCSLLREVPLHNGPVENSLLIKSLEIISVYLHLMRA